MYDSCKTTVPVQESNLLRGRQEQTRQTTRQGQRRRRQTRRRREVAEEALEPPDHGCSLSLQPRESTTTKNHARGIWEGWEKPAVCTRHLWETVRWWKLQLNEVRHSASKAGHRFSLTAFAGCSAEQPETTQPCIPPSSSNTIKPWWHRLTSSLADWVVLTQIDSIVVAFTRTDN